MSCVVVLVHGAWCMVHGCMVVHCACRYSRSTSLRTNASLSFPVNINYQNLAAMHPHGSASTASIFPDQWYLHRLSDKWDKRKNSLASRTCQLILQNSMNWLPGSSFGRTLPAGLLDWTRRTIRWSWSRCNPRPLDRREDVWRLANLRTSE